MKGLGKTGFFKICHDRLPFFCAFFHRVQIRHRKAWEQLSHAIFTHIRVRFQETTCSADEQLR